MTLLTPEKAYIFRIVHIANVPWILDNGLHCRNSRQHDPDFVEIGNSELIEKRKQREVDSPQGGVLSDYVPFYFTPHSPMLYNIKTGYQGLTQRPMKDIVVMVSSLPKLVAQKIPFVFSDRHANLLTATFFDDLADLHHIPWKLLNNRDFKRDPNDPSKFERYQAEALVYKHLPVAALSGIICYGEAQKSILRGHIEKRRQTMKVEVQPGCYF